MGNLIRSGDSVGARTQDLLLRRQLLYPAELPDRPCKAAMMVQTECRKLAFCRGAAHLRRRIFSNSAAKVENFSETSKFSSL